MSTSKIDFSAAFVRLMLLGILCLAAAVIGWSVAHQFWLLAAAMLLLPFFLVWPVEVALGMFAAFVPFEQVATVGPGTSIPFLLGAFAGAGLLAVGLVHNRLEKPPKAAFYWTLYILLGAASVLWAYNPERVLSLLPTAFALLLLYLAATSLKITEKELFWITIFIVGSAVVAGLLSSTGFYHGIGYQGTGRSTLAQGEATTDPNFYAASLMLPLSLAVGHFLSSRNIIFRTVMLGAAGVITFAILLTMSRGGLLTIVVMGLVYAYRYKVSWKLVLPFAVVASGLSFLPEAFFERLHIAVQTGGAGRVSIWIAGLYAAKHYFFYGAGLGNFSDVFGSFAGYAPQAKSPDSASHNIYLAALVELGVAGLGIKLLAIRAQLRDAWPRRNAPRNSVLIAAEAAAWAIVASSFFLNLFWMKSFWLVMIVLALSVKVRALQEQGARESVFAELDQSPLHKRWYQGPSSAALPLGNRARGGMVQ